MPTLNLTGDESADRLLSENPFALLLGMLLDQQIAMEVAFLGPARLSDRLDGPLEPATIAARSEDDLEAMFREKPALHRYPGSMARRVRTLSEHLLEEHDGDAEAVWREAGNGAELERRLTSLPGFGEQKAKVMIALLGKQCDVQPEGWERAAGDYAKPGHRSIADVGSPSDLEKVREFKRAQKQRTSA